MIRNNISSLVIITIIVKMSFAQSDSLLYNITQFEKDSSLSNNESRILELNITYPVFINSQNSRILNKDIESFVLSSIFIDSIFISVSEMWNEFVLRYRNILDETDAPWNEVGWCLDRYVRVIYNIDNIVSLQFDEMQFTGGVHPNHKTIYYTYDTKLNKRININDLFISNYENTLNEIGEKYFRMIKDIKPEETLNDAGYFIHDKFHVNDNFALTKHGILFYYNPYEIAPYGFGSTKLIIPYTEIKSIINKDSNIYHIIK